MKRLAPEAVTLASYYQTWQNKARCCERTTASFRQLRRYADDRKAIQNHLIITNPSEQARPQQVLPYPWSNHKEDAITILQTILQRLLEAACSESSPYNVKRARQQCLRLSYLLTPWQWIVCQAFNAKSPTTPHLNIAQCQDLAIKEQTSAECTSREKEKTLAAYMSTVSMGAILL